MNLIADVVAWRAHLAARALGEAHPEIPRFPEDVDPGLHERVQDALRVPVLRELVASVTQAQARASLRILLPAYLSACSDALDAACRRRRLAELQPWGGDVDAALAAEPNGALRAGIELAYRRAEDRMAASEAERDAACDEGARALGCSDARAALQSACEPRPDHEAQEIERGFVTPLDDQVAAATAQRFRHVAESGPPHSCDVPRISWVPEQCASFPASSAVSFARRCLTVLRLDPDAGGVQFKVASPPPAATELWGALTPRAVVVPGHWGGPRGCALLLERAGRAAHATFVRAARDAESAVLADPAHELAAGWLFRRIATAPAGPLAPTDPEGEARASWRLEDLIDTRRAFAAQTSDPSEWWRAAGRPPAPAERPPADGWGSLRGAMLAVLIEERLKSRFGRAWFDAPAAGTYLRELWASGPDGTPESVASSWGLGTMDSSPLLDAFRLRKGRES